MLRGLVHRVDRQTAAPAPTETPQVFIQPSLPSCKPRICILPVVRENVLAVLFYGERSTRCPKTPQGPVAQCWGLEAGEGLHDTE